MRLLQVGEFSNSRQFTGTQGTSLKAVQVTRVPFLLIRLLCTLTGIKFSKENEYVR